MAIDEDLLSNTLDSSFNGLRGCYFFIEILQDFMIETDFNVFYENHRAFYKGLLTNYAAEFDNENLVPGIEDYLSVF